MRITLIKTSLLFLLLASGSGLTLNAQQVGTRLYKQGVLLWNEWDDQTAIDPSLLGNPPGSGTAGGGTEPTRSMAIDAFDSRVAFPDDSHENYDSAISGFFVPDQDGTYYFHIRSDDPSQLFLGTDAGGTPVPDKLPDPVVDTPVAEETTCCHAFTGPGTATTAGPYTLQAGKKYGIIALHHEGSGGDYVQVAFTRNGSVAGLSNTNDRNPSTIPAQYLYAPGAGIEGPDLAITSQPQDLNLVETRQGTFTVVATAAPGASFQWQTAPAGSSTFTDIAGATGTTLNVTGALANNGQQYRVKLHAEGQDITSNVAKLNVSSDTAAPTIASATVAPNLDAIVLTFSEPVQGASAATYALNGGATVGNVEAVGPTAVVIHTSKLTSGNSYTVTATGIKDLASAGGNPLTPNNASVTPGSPFVSTGTKVVGRSYFARYDGLASEQEMLDAIAAGTPLPDVTDLLELFEIPINAADNYSSIKTGWFVPPVTGNYVFFDASDDPSHLYLSTDDDPAHKKLIAQENAYSGSREWTISAGHSSLDGKRSDRFAGTQWPAGNTITLVGGEPYYIEQTHHEGGGGDNAAATFKLASDPDPANGSAPLITGNAIFTYADITASAPIVTITTPGPIVFNKGDKITLSVSATGKQPITYQWFKNKLPIAGATSSSYVINSADYGDIGDYAVKASNDVGSGWTAPSTDPDKPGAADDNFRLIMSNAFLIELEDYNFGSGKHEAVSDTMPYTGNAYAGLTHAPVLDVDFFNGPDEGSGGAFAYNRHTADDAGTVEMKSDATVNSALGRLRGNFSVSVNYAIGWTSTDDPANAPGDWQNYTRVFPQGKYAVVGAFAHDGILDVDPASNLPELDFILYKVANPTAADGSSVGVQGGNQGLTKLGTFTGNATGAWGSMDLIPLKDDAGNAALIDLNGATTLRLAINNHDGDEDCLLFYNTTTGAATGGHLTITKTTGGNVSITFDKGTLKSATKITGPWDPVAGATNPYSTAPTDAVRFFKAD